VEVQLVGEQLVLEPLEVGVQVQLVGELLAVQVLLVEEDLAE